MIQTGDVVFTRIRFKNTSLTPEQLRISPPAEKECVLMLVTVTQVYVHDNVYGVLFGGAKSLPPFRAIVNGNEILRAYRGFADLQQDDNDAVDMRTCDECGLFPAINFADLLADDPVALCGDCLIKRHTGGEP